MTRLTDLFDQGGQSPWLDNLQRDWLKSGRLASLASEGIRGITSNPTIFAHAIEGEDDYDEQFASLIPRLSVEDAYWELVIADIEDALSVMAPLHEASGGGDGFVSLEVAPSLANDTAGTLESARALHARINRPNLLVKVPATKAGVPAIHQLIAEGHSINVTLIFGLTRYQAVMEAYVSGLEAYATGGAGDLSGVHSVASFFVSRVDTEVDRRLEQAAGGPDGDPAILALRGRAAVAQAQVAYADFVTFFGTERFATLQRAGAKVQRPLWASTSTKNPDYSDLLYVDSLIGPDTVNTMPGATISAFVDHGAVARTVDTDSGAARGVLEQLGEVGIDMEDVAATLEDEGVHSFAKSFDELLQALTDKAAALGRDKSTGPSA